MLAVARGPRILRVLTGRVPCTHRPVAPAVVKRLLVLSLLALSPPAASSMLAGPDRKSVV